MDNNKRVNLKSQCYDFHINPIKVMNALQICLYKNTTFKVSNLIHKLHYVILYVNVNL